MTAKEMAKEFINNMNPHGDIESADFRTYEIPLTNPHATHPFAVEFVFVDETEFDEGFKTAISLVDDKGRLYDYTFAETTADTDAIADGLGYLLEKWSAKGYRFDYWM